jgi:hypothetical protein
VSSIEKHVSTNVTVFDDGTVAVSVITKEGQFYPETAETLAHATADVVVDGTITLTSGEQTNRHGSDIFYFRGRKNT